MAMFLRVAIVYVLLVVALITTVGTADAAYVFHSGFELSTTDEFDGVTGSPSIQGTIKHTGVYAMECNTTASQASVDLNPGTAVYQASTYIRIASAPSSNCTIIQCGYGRIELTDNRYLAVYSFPVQLRDTGTTQLDLNVWYRVDLSTSGPSEAAGLKGYLNGVEELSGDSGPNVGPGRVGICTTTTANIYFDDIIFDGAKGTADLGDIRVLASLPNSDGYHDDWTAVGNSTDKWENVNEIPVNEADYNWWECDGTQQEQTHSTVNCAALGINATDEVEAVSSWYWYKTGGGGDGDYATLVRDNSTDYFDWTIPDIKTAGWASRYDATMPNGGGNWTQARFDAFEIGMATDDANKDVWMYEAMAMVAYSVPPPESAYNIIVTSAGATLYEDLGPGSNITWGLELWTPTEFLDGAEKTGTVTLTASLAT